MTLLHHPGSDHQIAVIELDAGHARDIMLMLTDAHALVSDFADGTAPAAAAEAAARLGDADSPYNLQGLADALGEVITWLHQASRDAMAGIPGIS